MSEASDDRCISLLVGHARRWQRRRWRGLVWLSGPAEQARRLALTLWHAQPWQAPLWVGDPQEAPVSPCLPAAKARTRLGAEHQLIVMDVSGRDGLDPDALGALAGTLTAGGILLLVTPEPWGERPDPNYARFADHPWQWTALSSFYLARLARQLSASPQVVRWPVAGPLVLSRLPAGQPSPRRPEDPACLTPDQARAVTALSKLKRRRPLVITADRGRGKSAALGIACARLLQQGSYPRLLLTAPRASAVDSLFERVMALCPEAQRHGHEVQLPATGSSLCFLPPDVLDTQLAQGILGGNGALLLVDEAAALPAAMLARWLAAFPRMAFATTVHGYEGSGRGFALRFREVLERQTPQWRELTLETPIRWAANDPLESVIQRALLLNAPLPEAHAHGLIDAQTLSVSQAQLAANEPLLEQLFGLLVQSHYRTTPSDLRQLMDGPGTRLRMVMASQGHASAAATGATEAAPLAVLVTREEGGFDPALAEQVALGQRRPQGHLLAQSLAAHGGHREALTARWRRVVRIAAHPERRREGLGRRLLAADMASAAEQGVALYGATFGAEAGLLSFWLALGFTPVRLGVTREAATGEYAIMVAKPLTETGQAVLQSMQQGFVASLQGLLAFELRDLPAPVVALLLSELPERPLSAVERQTIHDVAYAHRDPALARAALQALGREASRAPMGEARLAHQQLVAWAYQNQPLADAPREATQQLRRVTRQLMTASMLFSDGQERLK